MYNVWRPWWRRSIGVGLCLVRFVMDPSDDFVCRIAVSLLPTPSITQSVGIRLWPLPCPPGPSHTRTKIHTTVQSLLLQETSLSRPSHHSYLVPSSSKRSSSFVVCSVPAGRSPMLQMKRVGLSVGTPNFRCRLSPAFDRDSLMDAGLAKSTGSCVPPSGPFRSCIR